MFEKVGELRLLSRVVQPLCSTNSKAVNALGLCTDYRPPPVLASTPTTTCRSHVTQTNGGDPTMGDRRTSPPLLPFTFLDPETWNPLEPGEVLRRITESKVVLFGEQHEQADVLKAQMWVVTSLYRTLTGAAPTPVESESADPTVNMNIVMEQFSLRHNQFLERFNRGDLSVDEVLALREEDNTEGFDFDNYYRFILEAGKMTGASFYGGFIPRPFARLLVNKAKAQPQQALSSSSSASAPVNESCPAVSATKVPDATQGSSVEGEAPVSTEAMHIINNACAELWGFSMSNHIPGHEGHLRYFSYLISGQYDKTKRVERGRGIFGAQTIKDSSMAYAIDRLVTQSTTQSGDTETGVSATLENNKVIDGTVPKVIGIMGSGHIDYGFGVPERLLSLGHVRKEDMITISCRSSLMLEEAKRLQAEIGKPIADVVIVYEDDNSFSPATRPPQAEGHSAPKKQQGKRAGDGNGEGK
eukprot:Clim_evm28s172 gene=Clim_evmTU28s172